MEQLSQIYDGWSGYQTSLLRALEPLTPEQLRWRPPAGRRSVGELVRHIALGRVTWIARMHGPGLQPVLSRVPQWFVDGDGARHAVEEAVAADDGPALVEWLRLSWEPVEAALGAWTVADFGATYKHRFRGVQYAVSRQWTMWRVMAHDIHHGGQIAMMLAIQGIEAFELRALVGHIVEPPLWGE